MAVEAKLIARILADNRDFKKKLRESQKEAKGFAGQMKKMGSMIQGYVGGMFAIGSVVAVIRSSTKAFDTQAKAIAQVEAGIQATGGAAGRTSTQLQNMAAALQENSLFGDEEILKSVTAQLLTFTNIANKEFDRTQQAVLDVATRIGGDLTSTAIMLGKALNDPVANLGALSRSGIQFTKYQKAVIKSLAETNRLAEAQSLILTELERQYGGSAAAAAEAGLGPWQQLGNAIGDLNEQIGALLVGGTGGLAGYLNKVTQSATGLLSTFNNAQGWDKFKMFIAGISGNFAYFNKTATKVAGDTAQSNILEELRAAEQAYDAMIAKKRALMAEQAAFKNELNKLFAGVSGMTGKSSGSILSEDSGLMAFPKALKRANELTLEQLTAFKNTLSFGFGEINSIFLKSGQKIQTVTFDIGQVISGGVDAIISGFNMNGLKGALQNMQKFIGDAMVNLGKSLVMVNTGKLAFKIADPITGIAIGGSLIAAGAVLGATADKQFNALGGTGGFTSPGGGSGRSFTGSGQSSFRIPNEVTLKWPNGGVAGQIKIEQTKFNRVSR